MPTARAPDFPRVLRVRCTLPTGIFDGVLKVDRLTIARAGVIALIVCANGITAYLKMAAHWKKRPRWPTTPTPAPHNSTTLALMTLPSQRRTGGGFEQNWFVAEGTLCANVAQRSTRPLLFNDAIKRLAFAPRLRQRYGPRLNYAS